MQPLTDEERKRLIVAVREVALMWGGGSEPRIITEKAAEEIERLSNEVRKLRDELEFVRQDEERFIYD